MKDLFDKPISDLDILLKDLGSLSTSDLLAIDGPKFIIDRSGAALAVIISPDKWKMLNHPIPAVKSNGVTKFYAGAQTYLTIPVENIGRGVTLWQAKPSTGLEIITLRSRKKVSQ